MSVWGTTQDGDHVFELAANQKRVARFTVGESSYVSAFSLLVDGLGSGVGTEQVARPIIYSTAGVLVAAGDELAVPSGMTAQRVTWTFYEANDGGVWLPAGDYDFGLHGGPTGGIIRLYGADPPEVFHPGVSALVTAGQPEFGPGYVGIFGDVVNLHDNGSYETDAGGVSPETAATLVVGKTAAGGAKDGGFACEVDSQGAGGLLQVTLYHRASGNRFPVVGGRDYTFSAWAWMFAGYGARTAQPRIVWYDAAGAQIASISTGAAFPLGVGVANAVRTKVSATAPANAVTGRPQLSYAGTVAGERYFHDAVQFEEGLVATPFVPTSSGTRSRLRAAVYAPAQTLDETQGWAAFRVAVP